MNIKGLTPTDPTIPLKGTLVGNTAVQNIIRVGETRLN
jgi:hypothetical protein